MSQFTKNLGVPRPLNLNLVPAHLQFLVELDVQPAQQRGLKDTPVGDLITNIRSFLATLTPTLSRQAMFSHLMIPTIVGHMGIHHHLPPHQNIALEHMVVFTPPRDTRFMMIMAAHTTTIPRHM